MISRPLLLLAPILVHAASPQSQAQGHAFDAIAWNLPADSVRTLMQARGYAFTGTGEGGDLAFRREDGGRLQAEFRDGRLIGFTFIDPTPPSGVEERYRAVGDSLRAVHGAPDGVDEADFRTMLWESGLSSVRMEVHRHAGQRYVQLAWRGPGWFDEMNQRAGLQPQPAGFTTVSQTVFMRMAVDTTGGGPRGTGPLRGRFRIEYPQPVTPKVDGVEQDALDAVIYEMEFDCAARRARLIARATYLQGRRTRDDRPDARAWSTPQPESHYARGMDAVCRAARGR